MHHAASHEGTKGAMHILRQSHLCVVRDRSHCDFLEAWTSLLVRVYTYKCMEPAVARKVPPLAACEKGNRLAQSSMLL